MVVPIQLTQSLEPLENDPSDVRRGEARRGFVMSWAKAEHGEHR